jgi:RNA polymerase II subunit A small phosphatase-like protein
VERGGFGDGCTAVRDRRRDEMTGLYDHQRRPGTDGSGRKVMALKPHDENEPTDEMIASVVTQVNLASSSYSARGGSSAGEPGQGETELQSGDDQTQAGIRDTSREGNQASPSAGGVATSSWMGAALRKIACCVGMQTVDEGDETAYYGSTMNMTSAVELVEACRWPEPVIGPPHEEDVGKKSLILDLDETLVHSSFRPVPNPDFIIPVEIDGRLIDVYVIKRPFVDEFLKAVGPRFEVIVFTASLGKYADPLLDLLDKHKVIKWRLFREACYPWEGSYVKDLQCMGRDMRSMILVDNSPHSYAFQPDNAVPIGTFIDDPSDQELLECLDTLLAVEFAPDVRPTLAAELQRKDLEYFGFGTYEN